MENKHLTRRQSKAPFAALIPRDGDKTRRPLARRYMRNLILTILICLLCTSVEASSEARIEICGLGEDELYGPVNVFQYFESIGARCSLSEDEALIMEYSFSKYCQSEKYEEVENEIFGGDFCDLQTKLRDGGVGDKCQYFSIIRHKENPPLKFSSKFKRRIYATKTSGEITVWFKSKGKGRVKFIGGSHVCL